MNKIEILYEELEQIRPLVNGRGKYIARRMKMPLVTYHYYMRGNGRNVETLMKIISACKLELKEMQQEVEKILS